MRSSLVFLGLLGLLMAGLPVTIARQPEDGDDDNDNAEDDAQQIAEQVDGEEASVPTPPAKTLQQEPIAGPVLETSLPKVLNLPGKVGLPTELDRFGKHEKPTSASKPVNMAASLDAFGKKEKKQAPTKEAQAKADATNAKLAAGVAKNAAKVADKVATHTVHMVEHAKSALKDAQDALHKARVESKGLSKSQKKTLKDAEHKLKGATAVSDAKASKAAKAAAAKQAEEMERRKAMKMKMEKLKLEKAQKRNGELDAMREEIKDLKKQLKEKDGDSKESEELLQDLQDQIKEMEEAEKKDNHKDKKHHDEMKAEIERLRAQIKDMDDKGKVTYDIPPAEEPKEEKAGLATGEAEMKKKEKAESKEGEEDVEKYKVNMKPLAASEEESDEGQPAEEATPVEQKGIDIDTAMPYGDLEPFGREDTAQELTEDSIQESNGMVDQLERAEVAEEKRAVFRALTRLRGAAITSFDGVARSQTGNIDEYNKIHKWRSSHPLHHLADEESDISKWAFPDNAD